MFPVLNGWLKCSFGHSLSIFCNISSSVPYPDQCEKSVTNERGFVGRVGRVGCEFICGWLWVCGFDYCGFVSL